MIVALALSALVVSGCTPLNLDEAHVTAHGVLAARASCSEGITAPPTTGRTYSYDALMFLDGSTLVYGTRDFAGVVFYERSDKRRRRAPLNLGEMDTGCDGPRMFVSISAGNMILTECFGVPPTYNVTLTVPLANCAGFNVSLFD